MELTYQSPLMPASYTALSADEMTYIDGGAIQIGSYLIEFHPEALLQSVVNFPSFSSSRPSRVYLYIR